MKYEIENYKGQLIEYDDNNDKFVCDISVEDKFKNTKRQSLNDVRKEIDAYIKMNIEFKPFKALFLSEYDDGDFHERLVKGIRTDGKFMIDGEGHWGGSHYGEKEMRRAMVYDAEIVKEKDGLDKELETAKETHRAEMKKLCKKLKPVDLSKYKAITKFAE